MPIKLDELSSADTSPALTAPAEPAEEAETLVIPLEGGPLTLETLDEAVADCEASPTGFAYGYFGGEGGSDRATITEIVATYHNQLSGLLADDHPHYLQHLDFPGINPVFLVRTGAEAYGGFQYNLSAVTDPNASDDASAGYAVGSVWVNTAAGTVFFCADATDDAAVWREAGGSGGGPDPGSLVTAAARDSVSPDEIYVGRSSSPTPNISLPEWQIYRYDSEAPVFVAHYADGDLLFNKTWTDRESLSYP